MNNTKPSCCPKMLKLGLVQKSASSNARYRKRPTIGPLMPLPQEFHEHQDHQDHHDHKEHHW